MHNCHPIADLRAAGDYYTLAVVAKPEFAADLNICRDIGPEKRQ
jgi:hypothetical protein